MNLIIYIYILFLQNEFITGFFNESITIVEGNSVVMTCKIPRKFDKNLPLHNCSWSRTRTTAIITSKFTTPLRNSKYVSAGNIESGDCSLNITNVQFEADEGIWTCALVVGDKSTILSRVNLTVLVEPLGPKLYFKGTDFLITPNTTIYLDPNLEVIINLKCVSQMAYPPSILVWRLNGEGIVPKSEDAYSDIRPSTFMTVSSLQISHPPSNIYPIQISCIAFHPSYFGVKIVSANFTVAPYAPSVARIQSGCELKDSEENEIFKMEENQILPFMCMTKGIPLPNVQWEMKDEYNQWKSIFKHALQFAIFIQSPGMYRCLTSNKLSERKAISPLVLIEMERPKTVSSVVQFGVGEVQPDLREGRARGFIIEPRDTKVIANTSFKLNCILNAPIHNCNWTRNGENWSAKAGRISILKNYENGVCHIYFKKAIYEVDDGNWVCSATFSHEKIARSRLAKVTILHPPTSLILTYEGKKRVNGERILIDFDKSNEQKVATLRCEANLKNKNEKITWWINNRPETFPKTKFSPLSENTYQIYSSISLSVSKLPTQNKEAEAYVKCTINNQGPEIALKLKYPTKRVMLFPFGSIYKRQTSNLRLYCNANGKPSPEVSLQRQEGTDWQWIKSIPQRRWFMIRRTGVYRCAAKNILNQNYLYSKLAIILPIS